MSNEERMFKKLKRGNLTKTHFMGFTFYSDYYVLWLELRCRTKTLRGDRWKKKYEKLKAKKL